MTNLETYLLKFSEEEWLEAIEQILGCIHEVDRNAVQIWFHFYPLELIRFIQNAEDREEAIRSLAIQGDFELNESEGQQEEQKYWSENLCLRRHGLKESKIETATILLSFFNSIQRFRKHDAGQNQI